MSARRTRSTSGSLPDTANGKPTVSARALAQIIERSARIQGPAAAAYVERLRRAHPGALPADIVSKLEKRYLAAVTASGAAVGSAALLPGVGILTALSAAAGETAVFLEATAFFALALAVVYGVPAENRERRRALVLAVLVGDDSKHAIAELIGSGRTSGAWLSEGVASLPMPALSQLNSRLLKYAVKRYTLRRGALLFGKMLPVGIGAVIGAVGNRMVGKKIVRNTRKAFGTPPARWPVSLHVLPTVRDAG
jgi:F0F1-type ATP synthase membrane subunit c/vacuolar-type H+-ATPase subunit K